MIKFIVIYWIATTIYGVYWLIKNPSSRHGDDPEYFTVLEVLGKVFPSALLAWLFVPMGLLHQIKFKRNKSSLKTTEERMQKHFVIGILVIAGLLSAVLTFLILQLK